jgi:hypothetical protein
MDSEFTFYDYIEDDGTNAIIAWLDAHGPKAKARFNAIIAHLRATPKGQWTRPSVDTLDGECTGLFEIRAKVKGVQLRLLGFHHEGPDKEVTLVLGAVEKSNRFVPPSTCQQAQQRKQRATNDHRIHRRLHVG